MNTLALSAVPAYVQNTDNHHNNHGHDGISLKDMLNIDSKFLDRSFRDTHQDIAAVSIAVEKTAAATHLSTEKTAAANQVALSKALSDALLAQSLQFSDTKNMLVSGFKDGLLLASQNAAAAALTACANTAAIQASIAECCCTTKELIREQNGLTRDLINANAMQDVRDKLLDAKFAALNVKGDK